MTKIAFIGAGNMNGAIIGGLINNGISPESVMVTNPSREKREALTSKYGILNTTNNDEAIEFADVVVLGVKPYLIVEVCEAFTKNVNINGKCFVSVAAGCLLKDIQQALHHDSPIIRTMPNTPSQVGLGMTGMYANQFVTPEQKASVEKIIACTGEFVWLEKEEEIDNVISVSGSGPAYFFLFMEAMENHAKTLGFTSKEARLLVQQTALGAANMVVQNPELEISQLRTNVTSKGGTTQAALLAFTDGKLPELVETAMNAAISRAKEMADNS
jgi:pyrroline-5-carboxylate reductase